MTIPIPDANHDDEPTTCVHINDLWIPVVLGALQAFLNPPQWGIDKNAIHPYMLTPRPIWEGDEEAQFLAEQQILAIMDALMLGNCLEDDEMPTGSVTSYAGTVAPSGWLMCDGTSHLKTAYPALWAVLSESGAIFEEDATHFIVPDLRGRVAIGAGAGAGLTPRSVGQFDGEETHLLEINEMPTHTHIQDAHNHTQNAHTHIQDAHTHTQNSHNHTQNSHNHTQNAHTHIQDAHNHTQNSHNHTQNPHTHSYLKEINSATLADADLTSGDGFGNADFANVSAETATNNATTATNNATTATNQNTTATNNATTATNNATTATNQNTTATNQNTTATNQPATATNQSEGGDQPHNNMPPFFVMNFIIKT